MSYYCTINYVHVLIIMCFPLTKQVQTTIQQELYIDGTISELNNKHSLLWMFDDLKS